MEVLKLALISNLYLNLRSYLQLKINEMYGMLKPYA